MNMKRMVFSVETNERIARGIILGLQQEGRKPEVYLRTENIEGMRVSIFVIVCDSVVATTHGKNGVPPLPAIEG
jgi:type II secretory pathway component PulC